MADYSFAPGALKGLFGAYNFGVDSENTLENMFQRRETHDVDTKTKRLQYDILKQNEDALGPIKRQYEAEKTKSELELLPWEKQKKRAEAGQAVSQADLQNMKVELEQKERRMGAVEQAYDYMKRRAMPGDQMGPPSPLDASDVIILKTLQEGGWSDEEIQRYTGGNPQRLAQWVQQGAMMAEGDRKKLEERRKHLNNIQIAQINHSNTQPRQYPPHTELATLAKKPNWDDSDKQTAEMLLEVEFARVRRTIEQDLISMRSLGKINLSDSEIVKAASQLAKERMQGEYAAWYRKIGAPSPSVGQPPDKKETPPTSKSPEPSREALLTRAKEIMDRVKRGEKVAPKFVKKAEEILRSNGGSIK